MNVKEAKRLEAIEKNLVKKFREAEKEELASRASLENKLNPEQSRKTKYPFETTLEPPAKKRFDTLTVTKAKQLETLNKQLQHEFAETHEKELEQQREGERKYEAITKAIKEKQEQEAASELKLKELLRKQKFNQLMRTTVSPRLSPTATSTPVKRYVGYMGYNGDDDEEDKMDVEENTEAPNRSMKQLMDTKVVNLGAIGSKYLPQANDNQFGIYYDEETEKLKVGSQQIQFDYDDIILPQSGGRRFKGTPGLWKLLTHKGEIKSDAFTTSDWKSYKDMLLLTNSIHQNNDPNSRCPKSSRGQKWKKMIKPIWEDKMKSTEPVQELSGSGLKEYNDRPVEYRYVKNFNELMGRLNFIHAEEVAGNNNFHNEKLSIVRFINDRMEEFIQQPNGLKYLIRCLSALPEHAIEGKGVINKIIKNYPSNCTLHSTGL